MTTKRPVGPAERQLRKTLLDAGCLWIPARYNTKIMPKGGVATGRVPQGNAHVVLAADLIVPEVDDETEGLEFFEELIDEFVLTPGWRSLRGPKVVLRLPPGAQPLEHGAVLHPGVELLTERLMAPGSTVDGVYLEAFNAYNPIITVSEKFAATLAELAPAREPQRTALTFMVEEDEWGPRGRRERAAGRSPAAHPRRLPAESAAQRHEWLAESRRYHRHRAQMKIALQMRRLGERFEEFVELVTSNPVGGNLKGRGRPAVRLLKTWQKAGAEIALSTWRSASPGSARVAGHDGRRPEAEHWLRHSEHLLARLHADNPRRLQRLTEVVILHASWMATFGLRYYLSNNTMQAYLDITSNSQLAKYLKLLQESGLLVTEPALRDGQVKAMYWRAMINNEPLTELPTTWVIATPPTPDLRLLEQDEINWLLEYTVRREEEALARRARNARSARKSRLPRRPSPGPADSSE